MHLLRLAGVKVWESLLELVTLFTKVVWPILIVKQCNRRRKTVIMVHVAYWLAMVQDRETAKQVPLLEPGRLFPMDDFEKVLNWCTFNPMATASS